MFKKLTAGRALAMSAIVVCVCFAMLLGTTFAWFTDSVTSGNNIIKSGTLDVEMYWADGTEAPDSATWTDASTGAIFNYDKWEPGYVEVRHIKIANVGTLALKYQIKIVANGEVSDLADVIDVYYVDPAVQVSDRAQLTDANKLGTLTEVLANLANTANGELLEGENDTITLAL
jgi:predicted ribosomally synthesized peptide with SipW-like signal peptide